MKFESHAHEEDLITAESCRHALREQLAAIHSHIEADTKNNPLNRKAYRNLQSSWSRGIPMPTDSILAEAIQARKESDKILEDEKGLIFHVKGNKIIPDVKMKHPASPKGTKDAASFSNN
jgi:hypothetical protein